MKRKIKMLLNILALILCLGTVSGCKGASPMGNSFRLTATVTALGEKLEVNVTEGEYASGIYWVIISDETVIKDQDGVKRSRDDIAVGDTLGIVYNGQVMMSYPPQIVAREITIK